MSKETCVYEFGVPFLSKETAEFVENELYKIYSYRKKLTIIERSRRARLRKVVYFIAPTLRSLDKEFKDLNDQITSIYMTKLSGIKKKDRPQELLDEIKLLKDKRKDLSKKIKSVRNDAITSNFTIVDKKLKEETTQNLLIELVKLNKAPSFILYRTLNDVISAGEFSEWELIAKRKNEDPSNTDCYLSYRNAAVSARTSKWFSEVLIGPSNKIRNTVKEKTYASLETNSSRHWKVWHKITHHANNRKKAVKSLSGLNAGTSNWATAASDASFAKSKFMPKMPKYDHTGSIGIQLQKDKSEPNVKGISALRAFSEKDHRLKIQKMPEISVKDPRCSNCNKRIPYNNLNTSKCTKCKQPLKEIKTAAQVHMKLFGKAKNAFYISFPIIQHRELPNDAVIKWAYLKVGRTGLHPFYRLQLTVESSEFTKRTQTPSNNVIAANLGWRKLKSGGVRVVTFSDGQHSFHLELPASMVKSNNLKNQLLQVCDNIHNEEKVLFKNWIKEHGISSEMRNALNKVFWKADGVANLTSKKFQGVVLQNISAWNRHAKLSRVARVMEEEFLPNGKELVEKWKYYCLPKPKNVTWSQWRKENKARDLFPTFEELCVWLREEQNITDKHKQLTMHLMLWNIKDQHLINWARSLEKRITRHRLNIYQNMAREVYNNYKTIIVEKWNKSETAKRPEPENDTWTEQDEKANMMRQFVGVSVFASCLKNLFDKDEYIEESPKNITFVHFECGGTADANSIKKSISVSCSKCHEIFDQDINAAKNLLSRYCERLSAA